MVKPFLTEWSFLFKLRLFLAVLAGLFVIVFLFLKIVPGGKITYSRTWPAGLKSGKGFIYDFKPGERMDVNSRFLKIIADPLYFSLFTPRAFDQAMVTVVYRDRLSASTPIFEIGVLKDKLTDAYDLRPLQNNIVDALRFRWPRLEDTASRLVLQADKTYTSSEEFFSDLAAGHLRDCPNGPTSCVAVYNYQLSPKYRLPDYAPIAPTTITQPLRGPHQFYLYLPHEDWRLSFNFVDLNQDKGQDPITVSVSSPEGIIASRTLTDNNPEPDSGRAEDKQLVLNGPAPSAGVYKVDVRISPDVVIAKIVSSSDKLSFISRVWPVSGAGSLDLFTDATHLSVETMNPASLGEINFGGRVFPIAKTGKRFTFPAGIGTKMISLPKDDLVLENNGVFAFARNSLFDPSFKRVDRYFSLLSGETKYIVADYARPLADNGWKTATARLPLVGASRDDGKYTFLLSVPGLDGDSQTADYVEIKEIRIALSGRTLGQKIVSLFRGL